jgi:hypothetical protein
VVFLLEDGLGVGRDGLSQRDLLIMQSQGEFFLGGSTVGEVAGETVEFKNAELPDTGLAFPRRGPAR